MPKLAKEEEERLTPAGCSSPAALPLDEALADCLMTSLNWEAIAKDFAKVFSTPQNAPTSQTKDQEGEPVAGAGPYVRHL